MASAETVNESESVVGHKSYINRDEFCEWLMNKISRQSTMISRSYGEKIIQYLRDLREKGIDNQELRSKYSSTFRFQIKKRKFQLINVVGLGDILCLPIKDKTKSSHAMLGQHRQVIFKEDMFDVIDNAHINGERHRGYKGTFKKINATYCNIPREVVHKYVNMCQFCQKAHACFVPTTFKKTAGNPKKKLNKTQPKKKEVEMTFLTRCQVDILDMQSFPDSDGQFSYIGHFLDHHTKYNVLFPLKRADAFYVARKLCRYVFGHFGLPHILHSNLGRKFVDELITWILQFWSTDAQIVNGNPRLKKLNALVQQRQQTIMILIETIRAKQSETSSWSVWLPGIQYSLNTNQFEGDSPPAFHSVFNRRPKVYTYAPSQKDIPREEDVIFDKEDEENGEERTTTENSLNEVITVSVSDLLQQGSSSILISQLDPHSTTELQEDKDKSGVKDNEVLSSDLLHAQPLGTIPYPLGDQYTIIGTTLGVDTHTIQIPVVTLDSNTISVASQVNTSFDSGVKSNILPDTLRLPSDNDAIDLSTRPTMSLSNDSSLELSHLEMGGVDSATEDGKNAVSELTKDDDDIMTSAFSMKQIQSLDDDGGNNESF